MISSYNIIFITWQVKKKDSQKKQAVINTKLSAVLDAVTWIPVKLKVTFTSPLKNVAGGLMRKNIRAGPIGIQFRLDQRGIAKPPYSAIWAIFILIKWWTGQTSLDDAFVEFWWAAGASHTTGSASKHIFSSMKIISFWINQKLQFSRFCLVWGSTSGSEGWRKC